MDASSRVHEWVTWHIKLGVEPCKLAPPFGYTVLDTLGMESDRCVYLDYNATTPLEPKVLEAITTALKDAWGNPSSAHHAGKVNACSKLCLRN